MWVGTIVTAAAQDLRANPTHLRAKSSEQKNPLQAQTIVPPKGPNRINTGVRRGKTRSVQFQDLHTQSTSNPQLLQFIHFAFPDEALMVAMHLRATKEGQKMEFDNLIDMSDPDVTEDNLKPSRNKTIAIAMYTASQQARNELDDLEQSIAVLDETLDDIRLLNGLLKTKNPLVVDRT